MFTESPSLFVYTKPCSSVLREAEREPSCLRDIYSGSSEPNPIFKTAVKLIPSARKGRTMQKIGCRKRRGVHRIILSSLPFLSPPTKAARPADGGGPGNKLDECVISSSARLSQRTGLGKRTNFAASGIFEITASRLCPALYSPCCTLQSSVTATDGGGEIDNREGHLSVFSC